jgi:hypothetical protein
VKRIVVSLGGFDYLIDEDYSIVRYVTVVILVITKVSEKLAATIFRVAEDLGLSVDGAACFTETSVGNCPRAWWRLPADCYLHIFSNFCGLWFLGTFAKL